MPGISFESSLRDQLVQRQRTQGQVVGRFRIGARPVGIAAIQLHALGQFAQNLCNGGGIG